MPTWPKSSPKHQPFFCRTAWHLKKSGLYLAVYDLIGGITSHGENTFFSSIQRVATYFGAPTSYESVRRAFVGLRRLGWLELESNGNHRWISHKVWAERNPDCCAKRDLLPWQDVTDPLIRQLYAISEGKIRIKEHELVGLRKLASDDLIALLYRKMFDTAQAMRAKGHYEKTSPRECLWRVRRHLEEHGAEVGKNSR